MGAQLTPLLLLNVPIFLVAASLAAYGAIRYRRESRRQELLAFIVLTTATALWQVSHILREGATDPSTKLLVFNIFMAVVVQMYAYSVLWFVLAYSDASQRYIRAVGTVAVCHVLVFGVVLTLDPEFFQTIDGVVSQGPVTVLNVTFQEWVVLNQTPKLTFRLYQIYVYLIGLVSVAVLATYLIRQRERVSTGQLVELGVGIGTPIVVNSLELVGLIPTEWDITNIAIGVLVVSLAVAVFRDRLLDYTFVGRQQVVERMDDPVVIFDQDDRIVDCNSAARRIVDADPDWKGTPAEEFFEPVSGLFERFEGVRSVDTEISFEKDGRTRHFDLSITPIQPDTPTEAGEVLVAREVTTLKEREQELDLLRQIQSRVLRHNVRNELAVVKGRAEELGRRNGDGDEEIVASIESAADQLLSVSTKTRDVETLIEQDQAPTRLDITALVEQKLTTYAEAYPSVSFVLDSPAECPVETVPAMDLAIENIIENAAAHNDAGEPVVEVTLDQRADATFVSISDNGPGIPEHELEVLERREETCLKHGGGVGLWLVQWVIDVSNATIDYDTDEDGTTITIRIPAGGG